MCPVSAQRPSSRRSRLRAFTPTALLMLLLSAFGWAVPAVAQFGTPSSSTTTTSVATTTTTSVARTTTTIAAASSPSSTVAPEPDLARTGAGMSTTAVAALGAALACGGEVARRYFGRGDHRGKTGAGSD